MVNVLIPKIGHPAERVPAIALVLCVWISTKKPKLATGKVPVDHSVAIRVLVLKPSTEKENTWACNSESVAWVLRPQSVIAVLGVETIADLVDQCELSLTPESVEMLKATAAVQEWWPTFEEDASDSKKKKPVATKHIGLFVLRQGRARAKAKAKASAKKKGAQKTDKGSKGKKVLKKGKGKGKSSTESKGAKGKLKKAVEVEAIPQTEENFTRSGKGPQLIRQMMVKCKQMDHNKFPGNSRDLVGICRFQASGALLKTRKDTCWIMLDIFGSFWIFMEFYGSIWITCMVLYGFVLFCCRNRCSIDLLFALFGLCFWFLGAPPTLHSIGNICPVDPVCSIL